MRMLLAGGASTIAVAPLLLAGLPAVAGSARAASACQSWTGVQPPDPGGPSAANALDGVAVLSSCDAWAVGSYSNGAARQARVVRWRGSAWKKVASPDPGGPSRDNDLNGVAATSAGNAWAVGRYFNGTAYRTLILHWHGTAWKQVASPNAGSPADNQVLASVTANSVGNGCAVGSYNIGDVDQTLILHWNGPAWKKVASPDPGGPSH